ncbi:hypothetical protein CN210_32120 [Sinorhizobium meliloti]|nr:hypothetical protein CN210_32120 [Sinorhizobium meliloti]
MTRVTLGKSRVREIRPPGSVRAKPNGIATRPRPIGARGWLFGVSSAVSRCSPGSACVRSPYVPRRMGRNCSVLYR